MFLSYVSLNLGKRHHEVITEVITVRWRVIEKEEGNYRAEGSSITRKRACLLVNTCKFKYTHVHDMMTL